ncbi:MAG: TIR domain-containing protein [Steroidobacteraceae bacterium]
MKYQAFISYSHAADGKLAPAIQSALHRLAKPFYRLRALNVFRDKTGLSATPALWGAIEAALRESSYFILLASPQSAQSEWVAKEVKWWFENRSAETFLTVLTEGEIVWPSGRNDFDWPATTALPPLLAGRFQQEPLYVDLRWARTRGDLSLRDARFLDAILDLAAPLHGRAKNDLAGEEVKQSRLVRSVAVVTAMVLAVLAGLAWHQRNEAQRNAAIALERQRLAEQRLQELCDAWQVTTTFIEENLQGAIYDIRGRLHTVFEFEDKCRR